MPRRRTRRLAAPRLCCLSLLPDTFPIEAVPAAFAANASMTAHDVA
ncbi:exported hypothetical protein [Cupriavidus taiwanensis]|nr:exported hypothetical protein [Cupriavidus taiwanensis]SOY81794.1 exported hypothetical protein [Cupriavidus taiwanensis]